MAKQFAPPIAPLQVKKPRELVVTDPDTNEEFPVDWLHDSDPTDDDLNEIVSAYRQKRAEGQQQAQAAEAYNYNQAQAIHEQGVNNRNTLAYRAQHPFETIADVTQRVVPQGVGQMFTAAGRLADQYNPVPGIARGVSTLSSIGEAPDKLTAASRLGLGAAQTGMGLFGAMAPQVVGSIGAVSKAVSDFSPATGKVIHAVQSPFSAIYGDSPNELTRNAAEAADMGVQYAQGRLMQKGSYPRTAFDAARQVLSDRLSSSALRLSTTLKPEVQQRIGRTTQQYNLLASKGAPAKINELVGDLVKIQKDLEAQAVGAGVKDVQLAPALEALIPIVEKWSNADTPREFISVIANYANKLVRQNKATMPVEQAIKMKQRLQEQLTTVYQRAMKVNPTMRIEILKDAKSAVEQNIRQQIEERIPGYKDVNNEIHDLLETLPYVKSRFNAINTTDLTRIQLADLVYGGAGAAYFENTAGTIAASLVGRMLRDPRVQGWFANKISPQSRPELGPFPPPQSAVFGGRGRTGPAGGPSRGPGGPPGGAGAGGPGVSPTNPAAGPIEDAVYTEVHPGDRTLPGRKNMLPPATTGQEGLAPEPMPQAPTTAPPTPTPMPQKKGFDPEARAAEIARRQAELLAQQKGTPPEGPLGQKVQQAEQGGEGGLTGHARRLGKALSLEEANEAYQRHQAGETPYGKGGSQFYKEALDTFVQDRFQEVDNLGPLNNYSPAQIKARLDWLTEGKQPNEFPNPVNPKPAAEGQASPQAPPPAPTGGKQVAGVMTDEGVFVTGSDHGDAYNRAVEQGYHLDEANLGQRSGWRVGKDVFLEKDYPNVAPENLREGMKPNAPPQAPAGSPPPQPKAPKKVDLTAEVPERQTETFAESQLGFRQRTGSAYPSPKEIKRTVLDEFTKAESALDAAFQKSNKGVHYATPAEAKAALQKAGVQLNERGHVVVDVPGDGHFEVSQQKLPEMIKKVKSGFPESYSKEPSIGKPKGSMTAGNPAQKTFNGPTEKIKGTDYYVVDRRVIKRGEVPKGMKPADPDRAVPEQGKSVMAKWMSTPEKPVEKKGYAFHDEDFGASGVSENQLADANAKAIFQAGPDEYYVFGQDLMNLAEKGITNPEYRITGEGHLQILEGGKIMALVTGRKADPQKPSHTWTKAQVDKNLPGALDYFSKK